MRRDRKREGLRVCRAAWLVGVSVREYRELEAGERYPTSQTWDRICELTGGRRGSFRRARGGGVERHYGSTWAILALIILAAALGSCLAFVGLHVNREVGGVVGFIAGVGPDLRALSLRLQRRFRRGAQVPGMEVADARPGHVRLEMGCSLNARRVLGCARANQSPVRHGALLQARPWTCGASRLRDQL